MSTPGRTECNAVLDAYAESITHRRPNGTDSILRRDTDTFPGHGRLGWFRSVRRDPRGLAATATGTLVGDEVKAIFEG